MTIIHDYLDLTKKYTSIYGDKTLVLMQVGSFFEVYGLKHLDGSIHGSLIEDFSRMNDLLIATKTNIKHDDCKVLMAGFGLGQLDKYIKRLQDNNYTTIIVTQDIQSKNTTRSVSEIISPGTYISDDTQRVSNTTMCIWIEPYKNYSFANANTVIGVATLNIYTGAVYINQSSTGGTLKNIRCDELEHLVGLHEPSEFVIIYNSDENAPLDINGLIRDCGLSNKKAHVVNLQETGIFSTQAKNAEKQIYIADIIKKIYSEIVSEAILETGLHMYNVAMQAFIFLVDFIRSHSPHLIEKISEPIFNTDPNKLLLANHSLRQLNIISDGRHHGHLRSVETLLNACKTSMGKREFRMLLANPICTPKELNDSYEMTDTFLKKNIWEIVRTKLDGIHDMERLKRRIIRGRVPPKMLSKLNSDLKTVIELSNIIKTKIPSIETVNIKQACLRIQKSLKTTLDLKKCALLEELTLERISKLDESSIQFIKTGISGKLDMLLSSKIEGERKFKGITQALSSLIEISEKSKARGTKQASGYVKIHKTAKSNPSLIITKRRGVLLTSYIKKALASSSESASINKLTYNYVNINGEPKTGTICLDSIEIYSAGSNRKDAEIRNPDINALANQSNQIHDTLAQELILVYKKYIADFSEILIDYLTEIACWVSKIDVMHCKAYIAKRYNYCRPIIKESKKSCFSVTKIRHPLIEHLQTRELYVTNDLELGNGNSDGMLLYGTNAVGKTSFIRSIGIAVIMAQAGLYVPASSFEFYPYKSIYTRILGNDDLFKGLSTFAVEMSELRTILKGSDQNSLVLGDELCSGTESGSALSIFTAGIEHLHENKSTFLFATHFHEILEYSEIKKLQRLCLKHMAVIYDKERDMLIYDRKLKDGQGVMMYGLEVCKSLSLPDTFLKRAHDIRSKYDTREKSWLKESSSRYNSKKIKGMCEICNKIKASEVHHLQHQCNADSNGYIGSFHKNSLANLVNICETCHLKLHSDKTQHRIAKTTNGYILVST